VKLRLTCREVTAKVLGAEDRRLPLAERLTVRLHQMRCTNCHRFERQVRLMHEASARWRRYSQE
jgi:hypothetical protein